MAYFNQQMKAEKAPKIKAIFKKYGVKGSISVSNHSTLIVTISSGSIDFIGNFNCVAGRTAEWKWKHSGRDFRPVTDGNIQVNHYWMDEHFDGIALACLEELNSVMNEGNYDNSDVQTDYFDVGFYTDINIGKWNKPYVYTETSESQDAA
jgi:hypothetical protein